MPLLDHQHHHPAAVMPSRISGACNACRTRKQKCSGDRSGCTQCREAGHECTWPAQKKRGPAKGYIEGLEHRLHDAEQLLLQILPLVSESQLDTVTAQIDQAGSPGHAGPQVTPPLLNKKTGIEYWELFPLDSVDSIRRWQSDCATGGRRDSQPRTQLARRSPSDRGASQPDLSSNILPAPRHNSYNQVDLRSAPAAQPTAWTSSYKVEASVNTNDTYVSSNHHWRNEQPQSWTQPAQMQQSSNSFFTDETQRHVFW